MSRFYAATGGGYVDALGGSSTGDAASLSSQGFVLVADSGPTSTRPASPTLRQWYVDTTLGYAIIWDGANWRNPATAAAV
jgi:hypothetical protein